LPNARDAHGYQLIEAQIKIPGYADTSFSNEYKQGVVYFNSLPQRKGETIILGNPIAEGAAWTELCKDSGIKHVGISREPITGVLPCIRKVVSCKPSKIFLLIGVKISC
jgi:hypothetical protein